ncbi:MAG: TetR/AcrR family transcriptional regulator [Eubacteriales bacterium]
MPIINNDTKNTKKKIIDQATLYFYDKGYHESALDEIAAALGIRKSLISYHFNNKQNLALVIYSIYLKSIKSTVTTRYFEKYKSYDLQLGTAVEMRAMLNHYYNDKNAFRFYSVVAPMTMYSTRDDTIDFWKIHDKKYNLPINHDIDELTLLANAARGATINLIVSYFYNKIHCNFDDFSNYRIEIPFRMMKINEERIDTIVQESKRIYDDLDFKFKPYFKII